MIKTMILLSNDPVLYKAVKEVLEDLPVRLLPMVPSLKNMTEVYQSDFFSLAMVDYFLESTTGLEALKLLTKINEEMPIVFLHRLNTKHAFETAYRLGASDCLPIPFSKELLHAVVAHRIAHLKEVGAIYFEKQT